ncbi:MAG TPA: hypothetical protein VJK66_05995 [Gaiellaceae bacterium]|nr:hypothetical protein [Gaiellaceae bacterium]
MRRLAVTLAAIVALAAGCSAGGSSEPEAPAGTAGPAELEARIAELERQVATENDVEERLGTLETVAIRLQSDLLRRTKQQASGLRKLREDFDTFIEDLEKAKEEEAKAAEAEPDPLETLTKDVEGLRKRLAGVSNAAEEARDDASAALVTLRELEERLAALETTQGVG